MSTIDQLTNPLDDFFRALMRHHDFCMKQKAEADLGKPGPKEPNDYERQHAKCPNNHD